jgi:tetratricopeptide (TPR) repeat protein
MPIVPEKKSITPDRTPQTTPAGGGQHPTSAESFFNLGHSASKSGKYSEAINFYQKSLSLNPNNEQVHNNLGTVYYKSGQEAKAIESLQRAIAIKPQYADPHYNLGAIYHSKGMDQQAKDHFKLPPPMKYGPTPHR